MAARTRARSVGEVLDLLDQPVTAAAVGAAFELDLFGVLGAGPRPLDEIASALGIPPARCAHWLELVRRAGLLAAGDAGYGVAPDASDTILGGLSGPTWALLAEEARERREELADLPRRLRGDLPGPPRESYVALMERDPERAERFTRMLLELHRDLADWLARTLDLSGAQRMLDLGGGSGVVSMALVRRWPELQSVVIDVESVCRSGRRICSEAALADRIEHRAGDLEHDLLPAANDVVLECDVGLYSVDLFDRVRAALRPGGRFVIVDELIPPVASPDGRLEWAFVRSLREPDDRPATVDLLLGLLEQAGFGPATVRLPAPGDRFSEAMTVVEATR